MDTRLHLYFDKMAAIVRILTDYGNVSEKDVASILFDKECTANLMVRQQFPELIDENCVVRSLKLSDLSDDFFADLDDIIGQMSRDILIVLLYFMDRGIIECYKRNVDFEDDVEILDALNPNYEQSRIILLRRAECKWSFQEKRNGIQVLLRYFYFVDQDKVKDICLKNYFLDESLIFESGKTSLKLAISPVTKEKVVCFSEPYQRMNGRTGANQNYFRVEHVLMQDELTQQVLENIYCAGEKGADVLVFPEMLGTEKMLKKIISAISAQDTLRVPALVVFPSIWERTENDENNTNKCCMLLHGREVLFEQYKRCDFNYKSDIGPVYEDINRRESVNNTLNLLHVQGLGRICIIICVDYLVADNREQIIKNFCPTLVCSPSFSTGSFHFRTLGEAYFYQGCNWVWCNTCSAANETEKIENFKSVGMITTLSKMNDISVESSFKKQFPGKTNCKNSSCQNCIYYGEIPLFYDIHSS